MRFVYTTKLRLLLVTIVVALAVVGQARADQSVAASTPAAQPQAPTAPSATTAATAPGPTSTDTASAAPTPTASSSTPSTPVGATTPPPTSTPPVSTTPTPAPSPVTTPPAGTTTSPAPPTDQSPAPPTDQSPAPPTDQSPAPQPSDPPQRPAPLAPPPPPPVESPAPPPTDSVPPAQSPTTPPSPTPVLTATTTQTITQIQISGCTSNCQGISQVQTAQQQSVTVQIAPGEAELAGSALTPGGSGTGSQTTSTITQVQLGCVNQCFDTTSSNPTTVAVSQQILADLTALLSPSDSSGPAPVPTAGQSVTTQVSCQQETGLSTTVAQVQSATETSTTIQLSSLDPTVASWIESALAGSPPVAPTLSQTTQSVWQLQIGCLFYCVDSVQVQDAEQSSTTVDVMTASSGGAGRVAGSGTVAVVTQTIWQVQLGCLSWCYGNTQVQQAAGQSTFVTLTPAPPDPAPSEPSASTDPSNAAPAQAPDDTPSPAVPLYDSTPAAEPAAAQPARSSFTTLAGAAALAAPSLRPRRTSAALRFSAAASASFVSSAPPLVVARPVAR